MVKANVDKDALGRIVVSFPYDPSTVTKIKAIEGRRWDPAEKRWSFPNQNGILEKILKVFEDKEVQIDPSLQANLPTLKGTVPDLRTEQSGVVESGLSPKFERSSWATPIAKRLKSILT